MFLTGLLVSTPLLLVLNFYKQSEINNLNCVNNNLRKTWSDYTLEKNIQFEEIKKLNLKNEEKIKEIKNLRIINKEKIKEIKDLNVINEDLIKENKNLFKKYSISEEQTQNNHNNWKILFESDVYDLYKSDSVLNEYVNFSSDSLYNRFNPIMTKLDLYEHNLKYQICNLIYDETYGQILASPVNYYQIVFEISNCFKKINYLTQDKIMNDILFKRNGISTPYYNSGTSILNKILEKKNQLPLSCDIEFLKKFGNKSYYKNYSHSQFSISKFKK